VDRRDYPDICWSPPDWACSLFPLIGPQVEIVPLAYVVAVLHARIAAATESDTSPLGGVLHVAHLFKSQQGRDGTWPETLNARTGEAVGAGRTIAPVSVFRRLNALLNTTEFEAVCELAEASEC
jgi:hypothetical protein